MKGVPSPNGLTSLIVTFRVRVFVRVVGVVGVVGRLGAQAGPAPAGRARLEGGSSARHARLAAGLVGGPFAILRGRLGRLLAELR
ncbi:hypothetical protein ABH927_005569 [Planotetraspora sp. GP83]